MNSSKTNYTCRFIFVIVLECIISPYTTSPFPFLTFLLSLSCFPFSLPFLAHAFLCLSFSSLMLFSLLFFSCALLSFSFSSLMLSFFFLFLSRFPFFLLFFSHAFLSFSFPLTNHSILYSQTFPCHFFYLPIFFPPPSPPLSPLDDHTSLEGV